MSLFFELLDVNQSCDVKVFGTVEDILDRFAALAKNCDMVPVIDIWYREVLSCHDYGIVRLLARHYQINGALEQLRELQAAMPNTWMDVKAVAAKSK